MREAARATAARAFTIHGHSTAAGPQVPSPAMPERRARVERRTKETRITVDLDLDGAGRATVSTPLPFLSHMLDQVARHGLFDLTVEAEGDVEIDGHHTTEDVGITLGMAVLAALGDKAGIARYGEATLPM